MHINLLMLSPSPVTNLWLKMQYLKNLFILYLNGKFVFLLFFYSQHIPVGSTGGEVENQPRIVRSALFLSWLHPSLHFSFYLENLPPEK